MQSEHRTGFRGFTLIELLVVVAVVALLMGMLLPSLGHAREVAQSVIAKAQVRQLAMLQFAFAADNDGWTAGPNKTGARDPDSFVGNSNGVMPTSSFDWISPTAGGSLEFSANRAQRTKEIFEKFACPKAIYPYTSLYPAGGGGFEDSGDFQEYLTKEPFLQNSYLAPAAFLCVHPDSKWRPNGRLPKSIIPRPFAPPVSYRPRLDLIKNPSGKCAVADGTRYVDYIGGRNPRVIFDFDVSPNPSSYGSFTSSGPIYVGSTAYGQHRANAGSNTFHLDLSMRFFGNSHEMHLSYWDGHADRITAKEAWADPVPWYPRGSTYAGTEATDEVTQSYDEDEPLP
ncbi:MAG: prepilin-type N-terminal cleavage/methylation domain-containing protein [Phycisphaerales bacterium]|nr:prepilin-type N-terminal cleavage/methylation domain-containing protein [Phycisphaerales bacterium]